MFTRIIRALVFIFLFSNISLFAQCPNPTITDGERCGSGSIILSASNSTGYYGWYDSNSNGAFLGVGTDFITPNIPSSQSYYVAAYDEITNDIVELDGNDDYAYIHGYHYQSNTLTEITVEAWVKTTNGNDQIILSFDRSEYWRLEINGEGGGTGQIGWDVYTNAGQLDFGSNTRIDDGNWHHIAATYDHGTASIYIDGQLDATTTLGSSYGTGVTRYGFIGTGSESNIENGTTGPNNYFDGELDEIRIWSVAKTEEEIKHAYAKCAAGAANLEIYYQMDSGTGSTTLADHSGNGNNATWLNANTTTIWDNTGPDILGCCESDLIEVAANIHPIPTLELGENICTEPSSYTLDAGSHDSYLWQDGSTNQTYTTTTSGKYHVTVENSAGCQKHDEIIVSLIDSPTADDEENCGSGSFILTAENASFNLYKWYDASTGGTLLDTGSIHHTPKLFSTTSYYVASIDSVTNTTALSFDGVDDYVALNYSFSSPGEITEMTAEAWIKTSATGSDYNDNWAILDFDRSEYFNLYIRPDNGNVSFSTTAQPGGIHDQNASVAVNDGQWHHIAAVYNGRDKIIFVDGQEVDRAVNVYNGSPLGSGVTRFGFIGDGSEAETFDGTRNNLHYDGEVKEIRYWSKAKSLQEILAGKNHCLIGNEKDLVLYYKIDEGAGNSILVDHAGNGDGSFRNMDINTAWNSNGPKISGCGCESTRTEVQAIINPLPSVNFGSYICTTSNSEVLDGGINDTYLWSNGSTLPTLTVNTSNTYNVEVTNAFGCDSIFETDVVFIDSPEISNDASCGASTFEITATGLEENIYLWYDAPVGGALLDTGKTYITPTLNTTTSYYVSSVSEFSPALYFDGNNDYIALNYSYTGNGSISEITVEAWIKTNFTGGGTNDNWAIIDFDRSEYFNLYARGDNGYLSFSTADNTGTIHDQYSTTAINDGKWHHVAAVYNGADKILYVDGIEIHRVANAHGGKSLGTGKERYGIIGDGSEAVTFNGNRNDVYYKGALKDIRVWNTTKSSADISNNMNKSVSPTNPNLELYYPFSDGKGNSTLKELVAGNNGTLYNFDLQNAWVNESVRGSICETPREEVILSVHPTLTTSASYTSCISTAQNVDVKLTSVGGSGNFDYTETGGAFSLNGVFDNTERVENLATGDSYQIVAVDENSCTDTITYNLFSSGINMANSNTTGACTSEGLNDWVYITDGTGNAIIAINDNGQDLGSVSAELFIDPSVQNENGEVYLQRHFVVNTSKAPVGNVSVRFLFNDTEFNNLNTNSLANAIYRDDVNTISDIGVTKYNGPTEDGIYDISDATSLVYIPQSGNGSLLSNNYIQLEVSSFSEFWLHANAYNVPLPVSYAYFEVQESNNKALLYWATTVEQNNSHFIIERSIDGINFEAIDVIDGQGNANIITEYTFTDNSPVEGTSYYRLVQVDYDNTMHQSEMKSFNSHQNKPKINIYPVPCIDCQLNITASGFENDKKLELRIVNELGQTTYSKMIKANDSSSFTTTIEETLPAGFYIVQLVNNQGNSYKEKLIVE